MRVVDILDQKSADVVTVQATDSLRDAIARLDRERIGAMIVVNEDHQIVGMLSERDLIAVLAEYGDRALVANVGALMSEPVYTCSPDDLVNDVMSWMVSYRLRHLPVVEKGQLLGIVSIGDGVKHLVGEATTQPRVLGEPVIAE